MQEKKSPAKKILALPFRVCFKGVMKTKKITNAVEAALLSKFKSKHKIAKELGITYRRYCQLRQRDEKIRRTMALLIDRILADEV
jgi:hypothetical protein